MDSLTYLIILRLLHITCGIFWAGATIYLAAFIGPAVKAAGPEGGKFMQQLAKTNKLPLVMALAATINVLAGILLIWKLSGGFQYEWVVSRHGLILSTGALLAIIAYLDGLLITRPTIEKINRLSHELINKQPTPEQIQQLKAYQKKVISANEFVAILLCVTIIAMSLIRYL